MSGPSVYPIYCDNHPQVCVDWCDAYAYCQAVGKRLCGKIGGGPNGYDDLANASLSQWYNACTSHGANLYPYGNIFDGQACNGFYYTGGDLITIPVGSLGSCQATVLGYQGVFDLSGNVREWEDSCDGAGQLANCRIRGGSYASSNGDGSDMSCSGYGYEYSNFDYATTSVGFRCCSPS
jgi:sulfatase modifying factor 1